MDGKKINKIPDNQLLKQVKRGNEIAFSNLYQSYWEDMFQFGYEIIHDKNATKDIVQDVFCRLWSNREHLDISNLRAYLLQSVKHGAIKHIKNNSLLDCDQLLMSKELATNQVEEIINFNEANEQIETIISELPPKTQEVFRLSRFTELSNQEIADKLSMSKATVDWHIKQSLRQLRLSLPDLYHIILVVYFVN
ncbi:MAG: RNA polymerase sigma-70 factor [Bacteroidota bacterium]